MSENINLNAPAYSALGTARSEKIALPAETFDGVINMPAMHKAVTAFMANQRQGNAATKIRKYVVGGKQKGTGRARQGSTRAPHFVGGGTVFGPTPRAYDHYVPRQVRALAKKSAFNARARENAIVVIDAFNYEAPKTSALLSLISKVDAAGKKVLILTDGVKKNVFLSGRNIQNVHVMPYTDASTYHILWSDVVLVESAALGSALEPMKGEAPVVKSSKADAAPAKPAAKKSAAKKEAKTAAKTAKTAAKKTAAAKKSTKKEK
jgi:large subunit ribosomal protein L4